MKKVLIALLGMAIIIIGCSRNPVTGKRMLSFMSEEGELRIGAENDPAIVAQYGLYDDKAMASFITKKGKEMGKMSHKPDLNYTFRLLDSPMVNAFALPGGYVYFTRGIMAHFNNEAEFAGVLGHEIGHITARHGAKQYTKQVASNVVMMAGMIASPAFRQFSDVAGQGLGLLLLKYSRDHESQSDQLGVIYSTNIGYDSHEMADFFATLKRLSAEAGADGIPNFLSTHPDPADRYEKVHEYTDHVREKKSSSKTYKVNRDQYLNMIDGLVYGDDPKQGFAENNVFYHPELKFEFPYPDGWSINNMPTQVQMGPSNGEALMLFTLAAESTLEAAFNAQVTSDKLQTLDKNGFKVDGMQVLAGEFLQAGQNGNIKILTYFIKDGSRIYKMHGMALESNFGKYKSTFDRNFSQFKKLTDPDKLNRKAMTIDIYTVTKDAKLRAILSSNGIPTALLNDVAILNGMELNDVIKKGEKIKLVANAVAN